MNLVRQIAIARWQIERLRKARFAISKRH